MRKKIEIKELLKNPKNTDKKNLDKIKKIIKYAGKGTIDNKYNLLSSNEIKAKKSEERYLVK